MQQVNADVYKNEGGKDIQPSVKCGAPLTTDSYGVYLDTSKESY